MIENRSFLSLVTRLSKGNKKLFATQYFSQKIPIVDVDAVLQINVLQAIFIYV